MKGSWKPGDRMPQDVSVIALGNWPKLPMVSLDFQWLGFDMCDLLDRAVKAIHGLHTGEKVARCVRLKPVEFKQHLPA